ncbi:hypothetical protein CH305_07410 [Rhodococcus sp. 15-649-2-2]|uniref:hypothetical protein n=1 Tax=Rhodococcus sp. 15-649-2-2 TaxID=2023140 RepID=UPI000B9B61DF|nr:hypothetical protein [Rhodococcus sp. 15-649-2-2]OZE82813.1 hypothetical protein CH305_07410 [Rhodococcus sp. 15-649-2-2]
MESEAASAVVDPAISHAFVDSMDVVAAELSLLGWTPEATDGNDTCIDQQDEFDSEVWKDDVRVITLSLLPGTPHRVGKPVPPALQLTVQDVGSSYT